MANRYLFAGADPGMVRATGGTIGASVANFNAAYCDHNLTIGSGPGPRAYVDFIDAAGASDFVDSTEDLWLRWDWGSQTASSSVNFFMAVVDGSDQPWLALRSTTTSGVVGLYWNSGTGASPVWTLIDELITLGTATGLKEMNLKLRIGSPHRAELYIDNTLAAEGTFTQASFTQAHACYFHSPSNLQYISQILATAGIVTIGSYVHYGRPNGAGASSAWSGTSADIDDTGSSTINDTDMISSGTSGQRSTFTYTDVPTLLPGYALGDVFLYTRARHNAVAPVNCKPVRRDSGGTDNVGANFVGMGTGFGEFLLRYSGLTAAEYNASQFGVESAT